LLALIPARGGSKRILQKNIKLFFGKPLIAWTIEAAKQAKCIDRILVSTDDPEIAEISKKCGAEVPFLRPAELATDETPGIEPALHAIEQMPGFKWLLLLQPTSPLRTASDIDDIFKFCQDQGASSAVSICESDRHPDWVYRRDESFRLRPFISDRPEIASLEDHLKIYSLNGSLYLAKVDWLLEHRSFIAPDTIGFTMPLEKSVDIDTIQDWNWAEYLMKCKNEK
jgi:CMP-N,N'-diacetyllegionaminic acid synthase